MRRSQRHQKQKDLYKPKPLLTDNYFKNHLGSGLEFRRQSDYIKRFPKK